MNLWSRFQGLMPSRPQQVVTVVLVRDDGRSVVANTAGDEFPVLGTSVSAGNKALIQDGRIIAAAPNLPTYEMTG